MGGTCSVEDKQYQVAIVLELGACSTRVASSPVSLPHLRIFDLYTQVRERDWGRG